MLSHTLIYMLAYALPGLFGFFSFGVYTRVLTPAEYAVYSVGVSVAFLIGNVLYGWIRFSVSRFQAEFPSADFIPFALKCLAVTTAIFCLPLLIGGLALAGSSASVVVGVLSMAVTQALFDTMQEIRRARHQSLSFTKANIARSIIGIGLSVSSAAYFHQGVALLYGTAAGFLLVGVASIRQNASGVTDLDVTSTMVRRFVTYGVPLALSGLVFAGNSTLARVLVTRALGATAGGQYGAALDITGQLTNMLAGSVCSIMGPAAIFAYGSRGLEAARVELGKGVELLLGILLPTVVGLALVADQFSAVTSGKQFSGAVGELLPLLVVSRGLNVFAQFYLHLGFQLIEKPFRQVVCGGATLIANVALTVVLMSFYGLRGAAIALVVADLFGVLVSFLLLTNVFPMPFPIRKVAVICGATAVMAISCKIEQSFYAGSALASLTVTVVVGCLSYSAIVIFFDIFNARSVIAVRALSFASKFSR